MPGCHDDKGIVYSNRVLIGNWYESTKLAEHKLNKFLEQMRSGDLMLARYRNVKENLWAPADQTMATQNVNFGYKMVLRAPYAPASFPPKEGETGVLLGGRITANNITYSQDLESGCQLVGIARSKPVASCLFTVTSADYCDRAAQGERLKYNQEFMLALTSSIGKKKPLYMRYDPDCIPGINGKYPLYLSENPVSNARWRVLPKQRPDITRFEQEGELVSVNTDIIINHVATNTNLGINSSSWSLALCGMVCSPLMKTCLDVYGYELPNNIWHFYVPLVDN